MCGNWDIVCASTMNSANLETKDFRSREPTGIPPLDDGVVVEFTSHADDDVIKRIPVLGPTRKQTELFFMGKEDKPCTADPIKRHHRDNLQNSHPRDVTSAHRPSSSYNAFIPQHTNNALWLKQPAKPPKNSTFLPRPTAHASKSVSTVTASSGTRPSFQTYDAIISKQGNSLLTHWPNTNSGCDTPPRYCVINSIGNNNNNINHPTITSSRENSSTALRKSGSPIKDLVNPKSKQSFVITADTSSLLVQSRSTFKPAAGSSAVGARARAKSAIQKVSEANFKSLVKSRSAQSRFVQYKSKQYSSDKATTSNNFQGVSHPTAKNIEQQTTHGYNLPENTNNQSTTQDNDNSIDNTSYSPSSSNYLKRYSSDISLQYRNQRKIRSGTKQGRSSPRVVPVEDYDQSFLVVHRASTQLSSSKPHTPTRETASSPMAARRKTDYSSSNGNPVPGNKQTTSNKKGKTKTLTPSKHGYHPRSNSPTFKRLVQAVERLSETSIGVAPYSPVSKSTEDGCGDSVSTDSHPGYRNFKDCYVLNDFTDSDFTESDGNSRRTSDLRLNSKASRNSGNHEHSGNNKNSKISTKAKRYSSETRQSRETKPAKSSRDPRAVRHKSVTRENDFPPEEIITLPSAGLPTSDDLDEEIGAYDANVTKEPETRVQEGQPTQLHFFLPQLADSMSEVSGATATGRSYYQEQRLGLLSRNDDSHHDTDHDFHSNNGHNIHTNNTTHRGKHQNGGVSLCSVNDANTNKYTRHVPPPCERSTNIGVNKLSQSKQKHYSIQNGHGGGSGGDKALINGNGDRCLPRDLRNGHHWNQSSTTTSTTLCNGRQSPNKEDTGKHKRYVSPARNKNCNNIVDKGGSRRKQFAGNSYSSSSGNNYNNSSSLTPTKPVVSYEHDFLDGQLPSEKLKKQIDNFPTLVSMEYSESPTPQQVR